MSSADCHRASTDQHTAGELSTGQRGSYFYLSYAHSPPLAGSERSDPDQWVRAFFDDLTAAVTRLSMPEPVLAPGFFDREIRAGSDWKAALNYALGAAEVFVPLYSPAYFAKSWPGREYRCFLDRMVRAGHRDPDDRLLPVLWIPLPHDEERPLLSKARGLGASERAYAQNGLAAMLRLSQYRKSYHVVVNRLAAQIVELAETDPVRPSAADIDGAESAFHPEDSGAVFAVTVAAPSAVSQPGDRAPGDGGASADWPALANRALPMGDYVAYAAQVAEQLDFAVTVAGADQPGVLAPWPGLQGEPTGQARRTEGGETGVLGRWPGVILVDPWFAADQRRLAELESAALDLPSWVIPVLVLGSPDDGRGKQLADTARRILGPVVSQTETARRAISGVSSLKEFVSLMPILVAEAGRQYLRYGPIRRYRTRPGSRPVLTGRHPQADISSPPQSAQENPDE
jgi:hypothetical protein